MTAVATAVLLVSDIEKAPALLSAFPALQQKLAEAMTPLLKDSAKEIVAGVLNDMATKPG